MHRLNLILEMDAIQMVGSGKNHRDQFGMDGAGEAIAIGK